ncbi:MAG: diaminobutyrate acetyltransferase [Alphaproteobacteria bacterium]
MDLQGTEDRDKRPPKARAGRAVKLPLERDGFEFDHPRPSEGREIWELIAEIGTLERNTPYAYLMFAHYFRSTVVVARREGRVQGFVVGFRPPEQPDTVFVWQVGVSPAARGKGLGRLVLDVLIEAQPPEVRFMEATVTPDNAASDALFRSIAKLYGAPCRVSDGFGPELFPGTGHERERLFRIGPFAAA